MALLPVFLKLESRPCLVVGAGRVALEKLEKLLAAGAHITVVAPDVLQAIEVLAAQGRIALEQRAFNLDDLDGQTIVITATNSNEVNHAVFQAAQARGLLCNAVDDPPNCDFYFAASVERGSLQIAISTAGESPAVAQRLRREIDAQLAPDLGEWLAELGKLRREVLQSQPAGEPRKRLLHALAELPVCASESCPARQMAFSAISGVESAQ
jgi:siroheme synthase-like protein